MTAAINRITVIATSILNNFFSLENLKSLGIKTTIIAIVKDIKSWAKVIGTPATFQKYSSGVMPIFVEYIKIIKAVKVMNEAAE